ncbi:MAG: hypothetical protein LBS75_07745 [Synergistaceae bacterium]|nr:hypothetical protein [Synergistaceae bacterium]
MSKKLVKGMHGVILVEFVVCFAIVTSVMACIMEAAVTMTKVSGALNRRRVESVEYSSVLNEINAGAILPEADSGRWIVTIYPCGAGFGVNSSRVSVLDRDDVSGTPTEMSLWEISARK